MAKDSWLTVNPMSGTGNATLSNSGTLHTGRLTRSTTVTAAVKGISAGKSYAVNQQPSLEFIVFDTTSFSVGEGASTVTITGKSNSPKITFSLDTGNNIPITLPATYTANGVATTNGANITGDPGVKAQFTFSIAIPIPKNTVGQRDGKIVAVGSAAAIKAQATITQATSTYTVSYVKGDYINTINKTSEKVNYGGTATATATMPANTVQYSYTFDGWYDGSTKVGSALALSVASITSNRTFTAIGKRTLNRYTLTITVTPTGAGTTVGQGTYDYGSTPSATATPATGYNFTKWVDEIGTEFTQNPIPAISISGNRIFQAVFTLKTYTISASAQYRVSESGNFTAGTTGGTVTGGGTVTHGNSVSLKATPATGYSFAGWYEGTTQVSTAATYTFTATGARTLVGRFQRNWYTITFSAGAGGSVSPTSARVQYGGSAESTATANTGYTFTQWSNGTKTAKLTVTNITASATYAASFGINAYVVTYQAGTGVASVTPTSETVNHGSNAVGSTATLSAGYNFDGWYNGSTRVGTALKYAPTSVTGNMTLVAKGAIKTFSITGTAQYRDTDSTGSFTTGTNGGTVSGSGTYNYGSKATLTASAKAGYTFTGWYNSAGTSVGTAATYTINSVTAAVTVYARFQKIWYTVTYSRGTGVNELSKTSERAPYGGTVTSDTAVASTGYVNPVWSLTSGTASVSSNGAKITLSNIKSNCTVTALATLNVFTMTYLKNDYVASVEPTTQQVNYGGTAISKATLLANTPQFTYTFDGWYSGTTRVSTDLILRIAIIREDETFEARGSRTVNRYTITVVNGSGSGTYDYGTKVTLTANSITGKTFTGWSDGVTTASRQITVTGNVTYTANYSTNSYTVTYNKGVGISTISRTSETVSYGGNAVGSTATVSAGYTFLGWYIGSTLVSTSLTYAPTNVTANMSLTAQASLNRYTVTYNKGAYISSVSRSSETVNYGSNALGSTATVQATTAEYSYSFLGWYEGDTQVSTALTFAPTSITSNRTFEARGKATKRSYTATFNANGGNTPSPSSITKEHGAVLGTLPTCSRNADATYTYAFKGWFTATSGGSQVATSTKVTGNVTYYAQWTATYKNYTVTWNGNGGSPSSQTTTHHYNTAIGTLPSVSRTGYTFAGWYTATSGGSQVATSTKVTTNVTYYARWTVNSYAIGVSLHSSCTGRGTVSGGGTYNYGSSVTVTCTMSKSGDVFDGWYEGSTKVSSSLSYSFTCTGARNLVAKILYIDVTPTSLSYEAAGGSQTVTVTSNIDSWKVS